MPLDRYIHAAAACSSAPDNTIVYQRTFDAQQAAKQKYGYPVARVQRKRKFPIVPLNSMASREDLLSWPGRLDVTVGGGVGLGETPTSTIIRECAEEASLDPTFVAQNIRSAGVLSFPNRSPAGWILPGLYYLFDLPLQTTTDGTPEEPRTNRNDGEVESFELLSVDDVLSNVLDPGQFKPSSALALVDFLIRHGYITEASDPRYVEVCLMLRRDLVLPVPWS